MVSDGMVVAEDPSTNPPDLGKGMMMVEETSDDDAPTVTSFTFQTAQDDEEGHAFPGQDKAKKVTNIASVNEDGNDLTSPLNSNKCDSLSLKPKNKESVGDMIIRYITILIGHVE
ncbi:hypothetical protein L2E82_25743 [Cichorium intybus]|uniref:Uncharacterized protein n=1 Tax=Cichorium intybus TaxID=13427 RepID=A0ACB9E4I6_CICIN|nr:hypothetical protein L2E82_25743 [Cichorium intybus]